MKHGLDGVDNRFEKICYDILGMSQLGVRHVLGVPGDVSKQQTSSFRCSEIQRRRGG